MSGLLAMSGEVTPAVSLAEIERVRDAVGQASALVGIVQEMHGVLARAHTELWTGPAAGNYRRRVGALGARLRLLEGEAQDVRLAAIQLLHSLQAVNDG